MANGPTIKTTEELFGEKEKKDRIVSTEALFRPQIQPSKKTFLKDVVSETLKGVGKEVSKGFEWAGKEAKDTLVGISEATKAVPTGILGFFTGWGSSLGALATGKSFQEARAIGGKVGQKISYQPRTKAGQAIAQVPLAPVGLAFQGLDEAAKRIAQGEPETEAMLSIAFQTGAIMLAPALKGAKGQYYRQTIKEATTTPVKLKIFKKMASEAKPAPEVKIAVKEFITQAEKLADKLPAQPGLELRKMRIRQGIASPKEIAIMEPKRGPRAKPTEEVALETIEREGRYIPRTERKGPPSRIRIEKEYPEEYIAKQNKILQTEASILMETKKSPAEIKAFIEHKFCLGQKKWRPRVENIGWEKEYQESFYIKAKREKHGENPQSNGVECCLK